MGRARVGAAAAAAFLLGAAAVAAQETPAGLWRNIDDRTGEAKAEIRIVEEGGVLTGRIERRLLRDAAPDAVCEACKDERKGRPILGLEIIRGARKAEDGSAWEGGRKLEVRGYLGPFWRTQTWERVQ